MDLGERARPGGQQLRISPAADKLRFEAAAPAPTYPRANTQFRCPPADEASLKPRRQRFLASVNVSILFTSLSSSLFRCIRGLTAAMTLYEILGGPGKVRVRVWSNRTPDALASLQCCLFGPGQGAPCVRRAGAQLRLDLGISGPHPHSCAFSR